MIELGNYEFHRPPDDDIDYAGSGSSFWRGLFIGLVLAALGAGGYYVYRTQPWRAAAPQETADTAARSGPVGSRSASRTLGPPAETIHLPPLSDTEALDRALRSLLGALSMRPELAALLASDDLVRRFAVSVDAISRGASPRAQVRAIAPSQGFSVAQQGSSLVIDPRSFSRYDGIAATMASLDASQLALLYQRMKPRLEEAWGELGTGRTLDEGMSLALTQLIETPSADAAIAVSVGDGINYLYANPDLEALSAAEKHLIRMGPRNQQLVQAKLREFSAAIGM
jgi:hypothetical protein